MSIPIDRDRLTIRWVAPGDLKPNRWNHRKHPERQRALLKASMEQDGWIDPVIYNKRTGSIIDGHARIEEALAQSVEMVPVIAIDVDEQAERRIIARHDRIGALAEIDVNILRGNLEGLLELGDEALGWDDFDLTPPDFEPAAIDEQGRLDQKTPITCPHCGKEFIPS